MSTFFLPDLGEGLPEAEIVTWHVKEGDHVEVDQPLVSVETAKAVVEVPSPQTGIVTRLHAGEGDIVGTGKPLVDFAGGDASAPAVQPKEQAPQEPVAAPQDSGTVVGSMPTSDEVMVETAIVGRGRRRKRSRVKAAPAVLALAKKLHVDLSEVTPSGKNGLVTADDVRTYAQSSSVIGPAMPPPAPRTDIEYGTPEQLRGPRRAMSQSMSVSRDQVAACTLFDDADIHNWARGQDITTRVLRSIVAGCHAEPGLNAWYDNETNSRTLMQQIDLAMAVDTPDGLIVPVLRDSLFVQR